MKKALVLILIIFHTIFQGNAQIGINTDGTEPDNSAMLDVKSTSKGMLVPRMTIAQRDAISNPATGLLIFCTGNNQFYTNQGTPAVPSWTMLASATSSSQWINSGSNIYYNLGNVGIGEPNPVYPLNFGYDLGEKISLFGSGSTHYGFGIQDFQLQIFTDAPNSDITFGWGSSASFHEKVRITGSGQVAIGTQAPASSAALDITSLNRGFLPPRMNTGKRDSISSPVDGLVIYNTDEKAINVYNGTSWNQMIPSTSCPPVFVDSRDGKLYTTIQIGSQCWMAQNLNAGTMIDRLANQTANGTIEKYCYDNLESNCDVYGGLYQWDEYMNYTASSSSNPSGRQGICPLGWHVPSDAEWCQLEKYLDATVSCSLSEMRGTDAGGKMKETGTTHWLTPNTGATNSSGFTALPGGERQGLATFHSLGYTFRSWSSTESSGRAWYRILYNFETTSGRYTSMKDNGFSGRCVKD